MLLQFVVVVVADADVAIDVAVLFDVSVVAAVDVDADFGANKRAVVESTLQQYPNLNLHHHISIYDHITSHQLPR